MTISPEPLQQRVMESFAAVPSIEDIRPIEGEESRTPSPVISATTPIFPESPGDASTFDEQHLKGRADFVFDMNGGRVTFESDPELSVQDQWRFGQLAFIMIESAIRPELESTSPTSHRVDAPTVHARTRGKPWKLRGWKCDLPHLSSNVRRKPLQTCRDDKAGLALLERFAKFLCEEIGPSLHVRQHVLANSFNDLDDLDSICQEAIKGEVQKQKRRRHLCRAMRQQELDGAWHPRGRESPHKSPY